MKWARTYCVGVKLAIGPDVEQTASSIIGPSSKGLAVGKELYCIDIRLMASKRLYGLASADVPELGKRIACSRNENILIRWIYADAHDIP